MKKEFDCVTEQQTAELATKLAAISQKGDIWALSGTLGAGKSVFARAFVQSLCEAKEVPSPTFTLVQMYPTVNFMIYHYDLYRLKQPEEIFELGIEEAFYDGVSLIEWPERAGVYLPRKSWQVNFVVEKDKRKIIVQAVNEEQNGRLQNV